MCPEIFLPKWGILTKKIPTTLTPRRSFVRTKPPIGVLNRYGISLRPQSLRVVKEFWGNAFGAPPKIPFEGSSFAAPSLSPAKKTKKGGKTFPPFLFFFVFFIRGWKNGFHNGLLNAHFENFIFKRPASALCFRVLVSGTEKISDKSG